MDSSCGLLTDRRLFSCHDSFCTAAASCFHSRKAHDHRDGERYDRPRSRASAHCSSGIRRTADAGPEMPSVPFASVRHTLGQPLRREWRHGSILFGAPRSKSPSRRDWDSRDNGMGVWGFSAYRSPHSSNKPRSLYTESLSFWFFIARSSAMTSATAPSIFSVDFSLSSFRLPAGSVRT